MGIGNVSGKIFVGLVIFLAAGCAQRMVVDEWNHGIPKAGSNPTIKISKNRSVPLRSMRIADLGASEYPRHLKSKKAFFTVNRVGNRVQSAVMTDNVSGHYYSLDSVTPLILASVPESSERFKSAAEFRRCSEWTGKAALAAMGSSFLTHAIGFSLGGVMSAISSFCDSKSSQEYQVIRQLYNSSMENSAQNLSSSGS